jgi:hypothetical protein
MDIADFSEFSQISSLEEKHYVVIDWEDHISNERVKLHISIERSGEYYLAQVIQGTVYSNGTIWTKNASAPNEIESVRNLLTFIDRDRRNQTYPSIYPLKNIP